MEPMSYGGSPGPAGGATAPGDDGTTQPASTATDETKRVASTAADQTREVASTAATQTREVASTAAEQTKEVASTAVAAVSEVAATAKEQASQVTGEALTQAKHVVNETKMQLHSQAQDQTQRIAETLRRIGDEVRALTEGRAEDAGTARQFAQQASSTFDRYARRIESKGFDGVVDDTLRFARRRPGVFLLGAAAAGLAVGRTLRSGALSSPDSSSSPSMPGSTGVDMAAMPGMATPRGLSDGTVAGMARSAPPATVDATPSAQSYGGTAGQWREGAHTSPGAADATLPTGAPLASSEADTAPPALGFGGSEEHWDSLRGSNAEEPGEPFGAG